MKNLKRAVWKTDEPIILPIKVKPFECKVCTSTEYQNPFYPFLCTYCAELIMYRDDEYGEN